MSGKSYAQIRLQLQDLIEQGANVADAGAGTPETQIHEWMNAAHYWLTLLEDKVPSGFASFRSILANYEFKVHTYTTDDPPSKSAYWRDEAEGLVDFRFDELQHVNKILKIADTRLEYEGYVLPVANAPSVPKSLPPALVARIAPLLAEYTPGGRGPKTDVVKHLVITAVINKAGSSWRSKVGTICTELDQHGIQAPRCREHDKEAPKDWVSAFQANPERVREAMRKSIPACQRYFPARFAETFPNLSQSTKNPL